MKELYSENYVTVMTETEDNANKWKCICAYKLEKLILSNCPCYPKQTIDSKQFLSKYKHNYSQN